MKRLLCLMLLAAGLLASTGIGVPGTARLARYGCGDPPIYGHTLAGGGGPVYYCDDGLPLLDTHVKPSGSAGQPCPETGCGVPQLLGHTMPGGFNAQQQGADR